MNRIENSKNNDDLVIPNLDLDISSIKKYFLIKSPKFERNVAQLKLDFENYKKNENQNVFLKISSYENLLNILNNKIGLTKKYYLKSKIYSEFQEVEDFIENVIPEVIDETSITTIRNFKETLPIPSLSENQFCVTIKFGEIAELVISGYALTQVTQIFNILYNHSENFRLHFLNRLFELKAEYDGIKRYKIITVLSEKMAEIDFDVCGSDTNSHLQIFGKNKYQEKDFISKNVPVLLKYLLPNLNNYNPILNDLGLSNKKDADTFKVLSVFEKNDSKKNNQTPTETLDFFGVKLHQLFEVVQKHVFNSNFSEATKYMKLIPPNYMIKISDFELNTHLDNAIECNLREYILFKLQEKVIDEQWIKENNLNIDKAIDCLQKFFINIVNVDNTYQENIEQIVQLFSEAV